MSLFPEPGQNHARAGSGALALDRLGPDFRIRTSLYASARPTAGGKVKGNLILYGRGDPTFAEEIDRRIYGVDISQIATKRLILGFSYEAITEEGFLNNPYRQVRYVDAGEPGPCIPGLASNPSHLDWHKPGYGGVSRSSPPVAGPT